MAHKLSHDKANQNNRTTIGKEQSVARDHAV